MADLLTDQEIADQLAQLDGWERDGDEIVRHYDLGGFREAIAFINRIADAADEANHHPEITNVYSRVTVRLTTHDAGGITAKDTAMACEVESAATA